MPHFVDLPQPRLPKLEGLVRGSGSGIANCNIRYYRIAVMTPISLKLPNAMLHELAQAAAVEGVSKSEIIRACLEEGLSRRPKSKKPVTCLDLIGDLVGQQPGPKDASTNPKYLEQAVTGDFKRGRKNSH